ncbi:hypothetical protein PISMIDRAFT_674176 [Pisolithus microcarpus 441]|uniref:DUF218 domain-containing protein n=1 Tax=Pisolithus microcarpus 441 TaxID=765257 RepID=A0A0C9ZPA1_9AGAM|nr:hypothetical protein BKA83DRAFT_4242773 [Pisolithus microcarpus]KIK27874.1 hypothetical protein PISMIDRAFT_674176 [Pisolithus microcarpus 441]
MLPLPALTSPSSTTRRAGYQRESRRFHSPSIADIRATLRYLRARSRLTNLGVLLLAAFASLSLLHNLSFIFSTAPASFSDVHEEYSPSSILTTIERNETLKGLDHLIIVPGHAIWVGSRPDHVLDEEYWTLEDYQKADGQVLAITDHIKHGVALAMEDENSLLVFSGGQTRLLSTTTEAESYMRLALSLDLFKNHPLSPAALPPFPRATTETYALDSYQNLLFSLARFHEVTGRYPSRVTVVGYEMKRRRFEELHRAAIQFPAQLFQYVGLEPPTSGGDSARAREGEFQNGYRPYTADLYGCHDFLLAKRRARNPFLRFHPYHTSAPELRGLLDWCPSDPRTIYQGPLPWDATE